MALRARAGNAGVLLHSMAGAELPMSASNEHNGPNARAPVTQFPAGAASRRSLAAFVAVSLLVHVALFFAIRGGGVRPPIELKLPDQVELGLVEAPAPGAQGSPAPAARPAPKPVVKPARVEPEPKPRAPRDDAVVIADAGVAATPDAQVPDASIAEAETATAGASGALEQSAGVGAGGGGFGPGLGFGAGGFGSGTGGPAGAVIGLQADLDQIRDTSLILETRALLELIPEWERLLNGSGLDPLNDLSRVFVATPDLRRSDLVVSARVKGGAAAVQQAAERLAAEERGRHAQFAPQGSLQVAPWYSHGPTQREVALLGADQIVIARPEDIGRVLAVSGALARRHAKQPDMEQAPAPLSLLSMYQGEAAALSIEGVRKFVAGDTSYVPDGLRISLRHIDEYYAELRAYGYYASAKQAQQALPRIEALRGQLAEQPRAKYLGLRSAIEEAKLERDGAMLTVSTRLTMHQTRYLLAFVSAALAPRD